MTHAYVFSERSRFPLGALYITSAVERTLDPRDISHALARHAQGDWGDVCAEDRAENDRSLRDGARLFSVYHDHAGVKFWIITEWDRSVTTVLMPDDY